MAGPLTRDLADEVVERLRGEGLPGRVQDDPPGGTLRIVRVGAYRSLDEAERARADLAERGFRTARWCGSSESTRDPRRRCGERR